ncbi:MAG: DUF3168 domain-containing protein [Methylobacteriaceae bacterium]|nr:DUF3168 domain-containing protein [Methylobacteriaceae bacterium]
MGGTARLDDEPPRGAAPVYATFGEATSRDWSASGPSPGHETEMTLAVWSAAGSAASGIAAAGRMAELLDGAPLALAGHRLVNLAVAALATDRDPDSRRVRTTLRLRAATEVAG